MKKYRKLNVKIVLVIVGLSGFINLSMAQSFSKAKVFAKGESGRLILDKTSIQETSFELCGLTPRQTYYLQVSSPFELSSQEPSFLEVPEKGYYLQPVSSCIQLQIRDLKIPNSLTPFLSYQRVSELPTKKDNSSRSTEIFHTKIAPNLDLETLIANYFLSNSCTDISNIHLSGSYDAIGSFHEGSAVLGVQKGIILSTGKISNAHGPNDKTNKGTYMALDGDDDLSMLSDNTQSYDATVLEFDFVPTTDQIQFEYVFASEEYCDYTNSGFNDAFGFFLSGPDIEGPFSNNAQNIASLPLAGQVVPVSIDNINHTSLEEYYHGNIPEGSSQLVKSNCTNHPIQSGVSIEHIQFDGYTSVLKAKAKVIPCQTYHIKLAIGDVLDGVYDSAVFLGANSFSIDDGISVELYDPNPYTQGESILYEGCLQPQLIFRRIGNSVESAITVPLIKLGEASEGIDYAALPNLITIEAGQTEVVYPLEIYADGLTEGAESLNLELLNTCDCGDQKLEIELRDEVGVSAELIAMDTFICGADLSNVLLEVYLEGEAPFSFQYSINGQVQEWITDVSTSPYLIDLSSPGLYEMLYVDNGFCRDTALGSAEVELEPYVNTFSIPPSCHGLEDGAIGIDVLINPDSSTILWADGQTTAQLNQLGSGSYFVTVSNPQGCNASLEIALEEPDSLLVDLQLVHPINCMYDYGFIHSTITGGIDSLPYTLLWDDGSQTSSNVSLEVGWTSLSVMDANGCIAEDSIWVDQDIDYPDFELNLLGELNCYTPQLQIELTTDTTNELIYQWFTDQGQIGGPNDIANPTIQAAGVYTLALTYAHNHCTTIDSIEAESDFTPPSALIENALDTLTCTEDSLWLNAIILGGSTLIQYWGSENPNGIQSPVDSSSLLVDEAGIYYLSILNEANGCTEVLSAQVQEDKDSPQIIHYSPVDINCYADTIWISPYFDEPSMNLSFEWTPPLSQAILTNAFDSIEIHLPGTYQLEVENLRNGCVGEYSFDIIEDKSYPTIDLGADLVLNCHTPQVDIEPIYSLDMAEWNWMLEGISIGTNPALYNLDMPGLYVVDLMDVKNGCLTKDSIRIEDKILKKFEWFVDSPDCSEELGSIEFMEVDGGEGPYSFSVNGGQSFHPEVLFVDLPPDSYALVVRDMYDCLLDREVWVNQPQILDLGLSPKLELLEGESYSLELNPNFDTDWISSIQWTPNVDISCDDCLNPIFTPQNQQNYKVEVRTENNCMVEDQLQVFVRRNAYVSAPNAITPNGDGHNDFFQLFSSMHYSLVKSLRIFDRWGNMILEKRNIDHHLTPDLWDGRWKGRSLNSGVYVWYAELMMEDGQTEEFSGDLLINH